MLQATEGVNFLAMGARQKRLVRRYQEIDRERHALWDGAPVSPERSVKMADLIRGRLRKLNIDQDVWLDHLQENWIEVVGETVARNARPGPLEAKTLTVYVTSSAWLSELSRFGKSQMLSRIQQRFEPNQVRSIRLQLDPDLMAPDSRRSR